MTIREKIVIDVLKTIVDGFQVDRLVDPMDVFQSLVVYILTKGVTPDLDVNNLSAVRAYAFGMMCRAMIMMRRSAGRYNAALLRNNQNHLETGKLYESQDPSDFAIADEMASSVTSAMNQLSVIERQEVLRRFYNAENNEHITPYERTKRSKIWKSTVKKLQMLLTQHSDNRSKRPSISGPVHRQVHKIAEPMTHYEPEAA